MTQNLLCGPKKEVLPFWSYAEHRKICKCDHWTNEQYLPWIVTFSFLICYPSSTRATAIPIITPFWPLPVQYEMITVVLFNTFGFFAPLKSKLTLLFHKPFRKLFRKFFKFLRKFMRKLFLWWFLTYESTTLINFLWHFLQKFPEISKSFTAWKESVFGVLLIRIFPSLDWIRIRKTPNIDNFHAVLYSKIILGYS